MGRITGILVLGATLALSSPALALVTPVTINAGQSIDVAIDSTLIETGGAGSVDYFRLNFGTAAASWNAGDVVRIVSSSGEAFTIDQAVSPVLSNFYVANPTTPAATRFDASISQWNDDMVAGNVWRIDMLSGALDIGSYFEITMFRIAGADTLHKIDPGNITTSLAYDTPTAVPAPGGLVLLGLGLLGVVRFRCRRP